MISKIASGKQKAGPRMMKMADYFQEPEQKQSINSQYKSNYEPTTIGEVNILTTVKQ